MQKAPWLEKDSDYFHEVGAGECAHCERENDLNNEQQCETCFYKLQEAAKEDKYEYGND